MRSAAERSPEHFTIVSDSYNHEHLQHMGEQQQKACNTESIQQISVVKGSNSR